MHLNNDIECIRIGNDQGPNIVIYTDELGVVSSQFWDVTVQEGRPLVSIPPEDASDQRNWQEVKGVSRGTFSQDDPHVVKRVARGIEDAASRRTPSGNAIPVDEEALQKVDWEKIQETI